MKTISLQCSKSDALKIHSCAIRAVQMAERMDSNYNFQDAGMDLAACHCNGNKLDLDKLLAFDDFNFAHDVFGIRGHISLETGKLKNFFIPRSSKSYAPRFPKSIGIKTESENPLP